MYITINGVIGEKRIDLSYPINGKESPEGTRSADIAVVSMLSDNVQYWLQGSIEVLLKTGKKIVLNKGVYTDKLLNSLIGTEMRVQMIDSREDVLRTNKLEKVSKLTISLTNSIIPITSKMENPATPYLCIMLLVLNILRVSNHPHPNIRNLRMARLFLCP